MSLIFSKRTYFILFIAASSCLSLPASAQFKVDTKAPAQNPTKALSLSTSLVPASPSPASIKPRDIDTIAAVVNNEVITRNDLAQRAKIVERRMASQNLAMPPRDQLEKQLLERMISDKAQLQLANELGIRVDDVLLDRAVAKIAEQNKLSLADFRIEVERDGTPFKAFREDVRQEITLQRLREREVDAKIQITESEVDAYLNSPTGAKAMQEVNLAQILIRTPENASAEQIAARRARAEEAMQQLRTGADFSKTAIAFSDASDALEGGDLGWRASGRLPTIFLEALNTLKPGEVTDILRSANGFHIVKLLDKRGRNATPTIQQTHARHILIRSKEGVTDDEARDRLKRLRERIVAGADFAELAKVHSDDPSSSKGGDLGWMSPGDTVPEFERAMNQLRENEISSPIQTTFGWHLVQVIERRTEGVSEERRRALARNTIRARKADEAYQDWLRQTRDRAFVEYRLEEK